jgi:hypothetical protein
MTRARSYFHGIDRLAFSVPAWQIFQKNHPRFPQMEPIRGSVQVSFLVSPMRLMVDKNRTGTTSSATPA